MKNLNINNGIGNVPYMLEDYRNLLGIDGLYLGKNIGIDGKNLTIMTLSLNRSTLTIRLMNSIVNCIPYFKGRFLIIDNGSEAKEIEILKKHCDTMPYRCNLIELKNNYGVAGGRNRGMNFVDTDWAMCLDNDIYIIRDPIEEIYSTISNLGCNFVNLPLLDETASKIFALGGHIYVYRQDGKILVGGGSVSKQEECINGTNFQKFLSTFLFGGACVVNKHSFQQLGGYDEGMFVGFEDIDFSITLFRNGIKIGNCGSLFLVHDHKKSINKIDVDYEKKRFSENRLRESAEYFQKKNGIYVWGSNVEAWLKEKQEQLEINDKNQEFNYIDKKPKIALVIDAHGWAFENIVNQLQKYLSEYFEFKIIIMAEMQSLYMFIELIKDCDLIHFFWRASIMMLLNEKNGEMYGKSKNINYEKFLYNLNISTAVYDHLFLDTNSINMNKQIYNISPNYYVSSKKLYDIYTNLPFSNKPKAIIEDGVDLNLFKPKNIERLKNISDREIVIGWCGNSKWTSEIEDFKGVETILKPAIKQLIYEGYPIKMYFVDKNEGMIPHNEMVNYYSNIDLYVCTSKIEGTPNPILEAMACGIPIISTDVGIVPQVLGYKQKQFILKERSIQCLKEAIKKIIREPKKFIEFSEENLSEIKKWDWSIRVRKFKEFFEYCLKSKR